MFLRPRFFVLSLAFVASGCEPSGEDVNAFEDPDEIDHEQVQQAAATVPAFLGAEGGGAAGVGGRGGAVIEVTNTNDSGPGSLRACVGASGPRTCVFRVGGTITLTSGLSIVNPYLTVAGQTAPGGGILIKGSGFNLVKISAHDVIWRYTRIRNGYHSVCGSSSDSECGATLMAFGHDIVVDHNSTSWNQDEGIGSWGWSGSDPANLTFSSNLVAEGLISHSTGYITGGSNAASQVNIDFIGNLTMSNSHRNPLLKNKSSRLVNNLFYNNRTYANQFMGGINVDVIGNLYKKGPLAARYTRTSWFYHEVQIAPSPGVDSPVPGLPSIYMLGNKGWYQPNPAGDQWVMTGRVPGENGTESSAGPASTDYKRSSPMANTAFPITALPVEELEAAVLPTVGASRRLDCDGAWVPNRDSVDTRLIDQYQTNTGISDIPERESAVGGFPVIASGTPCADADHDGMPDVWEAARGFNPNDAADRNTVAANGFTNLENYLNGSAQTPPPRPSKPEAPTGLRISTGSTEQCGAPGTCAAQFHDDFSSSVLSPAWAFTDPRGDSSYSLTSNPGHLAISAPAGKTHDCWGTTAQCPRMLRAFDNSNAVFEAKIDGDNLSAEFQEWGIFAYEDDLNYIRFEFWPRSGTPKPVVSEVIDGTGVNKLGPGSPVVLGTSTYLRVTRAGTSFKFDYKLDGGPWTNLGTFTSNINIKKVGVHVVNFAWTEANTPATTAYLDDFKITPL